jgi:phage terminase large subunit
VRYWSAKGDEAAHYAYPNGSKLYVGGMDNAAKIMSTEYDMALWDEATEGDLNEWEALGTRMRYGRMPYQQRIACVNPQGPSHWLNQRANAGRITRILSRHEDNPTVTPAYIAVLDALTGVRRARLYLGLWQAAEGGVYENEWDAQRHLIDRFPIPADWPRYLAVDFGYTHPAVVQWWAQDPDGRLYRYRELYRTHQLVHDVADTIRAVSKWGAKDGEAMPRAIISDPEDAEGRAQLARHLGMYTVAANKAVQQGIQAVQARLRPAGDGKPRLFLLRDSLIGDRDPYLTDQRAPCCTEEEIDGYVWDTRSGARRGEQPLKENDHGCDAMRYAVAYHDLPTNGVSYGRVIY